MDDAGLHRLLRRFHQEGVQYILVGGQAVRLNGFVRATEDIDILLPSSIDNGRRVIRALDFLPSSAELQAEWFEVPSDAPENIRVADDLQIDLLFAANGQTYESLAEHVRKLDIDGVLVKTLDIEGLLLTKTDYRPKDLVDRQVLMEMKSLVDLARNVTLRDIQSSSAIRKIGYEPGTRMVLVVFTDSDTVYGYPHLSDAEVRGLAAVLENDASLGHYVATVIKPNHDHERIQF